jgi:hypothetical protein
MNADVMWRALAWPGLEHLRVRDASGAIAADSVLLAHVEGSPVRLFYQLECDLDWRTRRVRVELPARGREVSLESPEAGRWRGPRGEPLPDLDGCVDVDIALTPFTNTLPILRLRLRAGESRELRMVYFRPPDFRPEAAVQRYTCLEQRLASAVYRYESGQFRADLRVDGHGLVEAYPDLWERAA